MTEAGADLVATSLALLTSPPAIPRFATTQLFLLEFLGSPAVESTLLKNVEVTWFKQKNGLVTRKRKVKSDLNSCFLKLLNVT